MTTISLNHEENQDKQCRAPPKQSAKPRAPSKQLSFQETKKFRTHSQSRASARTGLSTSGLSISSRLLLRRRWPVQRLLSSQPGGASHALPRFLSRPANSCEKGDFLDLSITNGGLSSSSSSSFSSLEPTWSFNWSAEVPPDLPPAAGRWITAVDAIGTGNSCCFGSSGSIISI